MILSHFKTAKRSIIRQKYYALINILGLSVGLAAFILIALFVRHELSYDRYNDDSDRIFRIVRNEYTCSPPPMAPTLKEAIPEIQYASRFIRNTNLLIEAGDNYFTEDEYFWTDNEFFKIFSVDFIQGDMETVLSSANDILISESIASKYFGNEDPLGKMITVSRQFEHRVAGVFKDFPANSHFRFDIVLPVKRFFQITNNDPASWSSNYSYSYVKLVRGADMVSVNQKLTDIEKELTGWTPESGKPYEQYFFFQPVTEIHLFSHRKQELQVNGDVRNVIIFSSIALLILLIAGINYVNITTAMAGKRYKEVGMRKALGVKKSQLINQFLTESLIVSFVSVIFAFLIVFSAQKYFGDLMNRDLSMGLSDLPLLIPALIILTVIVGLGTGIIPSRALSSINVISIIKGASPDSKPKNYLRNILVFFQFIIALVLIILTINVQRQLNYIIDRDPGYDKEQIITMRVFDRSLRQNMGPLKNELLSQNNITDVSTSYNLPNNITDFTRPDWFCQDVINCTPISYNPVDYGFVDLYNIDILEGRNFSKDYPSDASGAFLVNETAVNMAGWESPLGMEISHYDGSKGNIVGVVKDFNFQSMHSDIAPLYLMLNESVYSFFSIKITGTDFQGTLESIEKIFREFSPGTPFQYSFFDESFAEAYDGEKRLGSIFAFFSILAILLACLGLFGMSSFTISQRTKEMGVRKVFGATNSITIFFLSGIFIRPVILANIIAWPVAYIAINKWLESFAYRTKISVWPFLLAALIVILITILTISSHSRKISRQTPVNSLRYE